MIIALSIVQTVEERCCGMTNLEKVLKGLECHKKANEYTCAVCPYITKDEPCIPKLCDDVSELLKAQVSGIDQTVSGALTLIREQDRHQAHWEDAPDPTWQRCTLCGVAVKKSAVKWVKASEDSNLNYCPHCGAIMTKAVKLDD